MSLTNKQPALLYVAKKKLGVSEAEYRSGLVQLAGVETAKDLDAAGFEALMGFFEYCGFQPLRAQGPDYGARLGMATIAQLELIRTLWSEYTRGRGTADMLNQWVERCFHVTCLWFLTLADARKAIVALKAMKGQTAKGRAA